MRPIAILCLVAAPAFAQGFAHGSISAPPAAMPSAGAAGPASGVGGNSSASSSNSGSASTPTGAISLPPSANGVPPTPAPAFPGLPVPQSTSGLPTGTPGQPLQRDLRPPVSLTPSQVADLQSRLAADGFYHGQIDGTLDGPTLSAVRAFQQAARLPVTGLPDAQTVSTIGVSSAGTAAANFGTPFPLNQTNQSTIFIQP